MPFRLLLKKIVPMRNSIIVLTACLLLFNCSTEKKRNPFSRVDVEVLFEDSLSIRAIEIMGNSLAFAANKGMFGTLDFNDGKIRLNQQQHDTLLPEFRAIAHTSTNFFMLSVASPALLYKTGSEGKMELVYKESGAGVFYDAMTFWNDEEGIALGDEVDGCLSVLITRDGGNSWKKLPCSKLPKGKAGEGAFAASNTNIKTMGDHTWLATTSATVYYSGDKGEHWELYGTPIVNEEPTQGIYSIDFYDALLGVAIGGDYTQPQSTQANKAITVDGGKTWSLMANGKDPEYKSCIQFVPGSDGTELVALGFTGISYSKDRGTTWTKLSDEPFFTLRFFNDSIAYAAGRNRIAKLSFK